jgi:CO/xanthine dehydrogenase Mo-binding subunit
LGGLLGAPPGGMGGGGSRGSGAAGATVISSLDDLEHELPASDAARWRRVLEEDARAQAVMAARGRAPLSEVYLAGAPVKRQGILPGSS